MIIADMGDGIRKPPVVPTKGDVQFLALATSRGY
jgi:hypothetical protein